MGHNLIIVYGNQDVTYIDLAELSTSKITFGTSEKNDIQLNSSLVNDKHGYLEIVNDKCSIYDCNSLNGIYINGIKLQSCELKDGATVRIDSEIVPHKEGVVMVYSTYPVKGEWSKIALKENITLGRDPDCDIRINHTSVSGLHAEIYLDTDWCIKGGDRTSGMIINGNLKGESGAVHRLEEKDVICIANSKFIYTSGMLVHNADIGVTLRVESLTRVVTVKGKTAKARGSKIILNKVNIELEPHEFIAIIGGAGAGKTTFLNAICGFERANSGSVQFNDVNLYENFAHLKHMIGYVPQHDIVHKALTLRRMLWYVAKIRHARDLSPEEINKNIDDVLDTLEMRMHENKLIGKLSGGQRKRASIAVELLSNPSIFFVDEPTTGLDLDTEEQLMKILRSLAHEQGKTILMVTHNVQNLDLCDKVLIFGSKETENQDGETNLLEPGGHLCYYGPPGEITAFFGVESLVQVYKLIKTNPEDWARKRSEGKREQQEIRK